MDLIGLHGLSEGIRRPIATLSRGEGYEFRFHAISCYWPHRPDADTPRTDAMKSGIASIAVLTCAGLAIADTITVPPGGDIQAAIDIASDGDIIQLEAGEYFPSATIDMIGKAITLRGAAGRDGSPGSIIDGQGSIRVLQCTSGEGPGTIFENLLITGGHASIGGGLSCSKGSPSLENCTFIGNSADEGGGTYLGEGSSPLLDNCTYTNNSASAGGGMHVYLDSNPTLLNCVFEKNFAAAGGGMYIAHTSDPVLTGCTFTGNMASSGSGMYNLFFSSPELTDCTFTENAAILDGGGMININQCHPHINNCMFTGNSAAVSGGSLWPGGGMCNHDSTPTLTNSTLCSNTPDQIYGLWIDNRDNCVLEFCDDCDIDCPGDLDGDGSIDGVDLGMMLSEWGKAGGDLTGDRTTDGEDLAILLASWGVCP